MNPRKIAASLITGGLGLTGLFMLPEAEATLPCGTWQAQQGKNSTGTNNTTGGLNINNVGNTQGNSSGVSNVACDAKIASGNRIILFGDADPAPADNRSRCETLQQEYGGSSNTTGDNNADVEANINNVGNSQGNQSLASNVLCGAQIASGNTIVLFGNSNGGTPPGGTGPQRCLTTQTQMTGDKNSTGTNTNSGLFSMLNLNNLLNSQGNMSGLSNVLCDAKVGSGNTLVLGGSHSGTTTNATPSKHCQTEQIQQGTNSTGINTVFALFGLNNVGNSQGNDQLQSNVGCGAEVGSGTIFETGTLGDVFAAIMSQF